MKNVHKTCNISPSLLFSIFFFFDGCYFPNQHCHNAQISFSLSLNSTLCTWMSEYQSLLRSFSLSAFQRRDLPYCTHATITRSVAVRMLRFHYAKQQWISANAADWHDHHGRLLISALKDIDFQLQMGNGKFQRNVHENADLIMEDVPFSGARTLCSGENFIKLSKCAFSSGLP